MAATLPVVNWADFTAPSETNSRNPPAPDKTTGRQKSIETIACALSACEGDTDGRRDKIIALFCVSVGCHVLLLGKVIYERIGRVSETFYVPLRKNFQSSLILLLPNSFMFYRVRARKMRRSIYIIHLHIYLTIYTYLYLQQEHLNCCL